jgi:hypothetical protein
VVRLSTVSASPLAAVITVLAPTVCASPSIAAKFRTGQLQDLGDDLGRKRHSAQLARLVAHMSIGVQNWV